MSEDEKFVETLSDGRLCITAQTVVEHFGPEMQAWLSRCNYWQHDPSRDIWVSPAPEAA